MRSGDNATGNTNGVWRHDRVAQQLGGGYNFGNGVSAQLSNFPLYYNAHDPNATDFLIIDPGHPRRPVTDYAPNDNAELYQKVARISRNLPEAMAEYARQNGIFVFTLGLGSALTEPKGPDGDLGEDMLLRMANDPSMENLPALQADFRVNQPQGLYCHAVDEDALGPCFDEIVSTIIRLSV